MPSVLGFGGVVVLVGLLQEDVCQVPVDASQIDERRFVLAEGRRSQLCLRVLITDDVRTCDYYGCWYGIHRKQFTYFAAGL